MYCIVVNRREQFKESLYCWHIFDIVFLFYRPVFYIRKDKIKCNLLTTLKQVYAIVSTTPPQAAYFMINNKIFISYAHVDNNKCNTNYEDNGGWVQNFLNYLRDALNRKFGREDYYEIWFDEQVRGNDPVTATILKELSSNQILLVLYSKGYLESKWCQQELKHFTERNGYTSNRIFFIRQDTNPIPDHYNETIGYSFYTEDINARRFYRLTSSEPDYRKYIEDVASDLYKTIRKIKLKTTIYLAPVAGSLN